MVWVLLGIKLRHPFGELRRMPSEFDHRAEFD